MIKTPYISVNDFVKKAIKEIEIDNHRKMLLKEIASKIVDEKLLNNQVNLNFICTHNSRRSQIAQTWAFYLSHIHKVDVASFSGGTETTAFHRNSVNTLRQVGFKFNVVEFSHQNPVYEIYEEGINKKLIAFSKTYDHSINKSPFIAITTCNDANEKCPFIYEALKRFHLPYKDPKFADNTEHQEKAYLATNRQIAAEINFLFLEVKKQLNS